MAQVANPTSNPYVESNENTVCIPLVQVFDPNLENEKNYINGRANLLALVGVVAYYAHKEDFDNSKKAADYFSDKIGKGSRINAGLTFSNFHSATTARAF